MKFLFAFFIAFFGTTIFAANCSTDLSAADNMMFDKKEIKVDSSCQKFEINFKHKGKLPINVGGHNVVIIETKSFNALVPKIDMKLGAESGFLPDMPEVIAKTPIIAGGQETKLSFDATKLKKAGKYTFLCSFPGHYAIMKGNLVVN